uniref:Dual oxidase 2 n=1 Tax=Labrus bergylta TaxID=56723 RepID=A0A3Q3FK43_9LABR
MTFYVDIYPFYPLQRSSFIFSSHLLTVILVFLVLALSLLLILPGIRGKSRLFWTFRIIISLFIGVVIVALNFTCNWAEAKMTTNATYKSFSNAVVNAEIGLHVGLYGINVTLKGNPIVQLNETIDYNEMFRWHDTIEKIMRKLWRKVSPAPSYFQEDTTAFCSWLLANILFSMPVILYAGYMMMATAAFIFFSMASFSNISSVPQCVFSIGTDSFKTEYSHSFWLALATGLLCTIIGILVVILNFVMPEKMKEAFSVGVDSYEDEDVSYGEGYLNAAFLDRVTSSTLTAKTKVSR